eukprot:3486655-Prymnesium_polylepis.1
MWVLLSADGARCFDERRSRCVVGGEQQWRRALASWRGPGFGRWPRAANGASRLQTAAAARGQSGAPR